MPPAPTFRRITALGVSRLPHAHAARGPSPFGARLQFVQRRRLADPSGAKAHCPEDVTW
jgi:hypothetical protein